MSTDQTIDSIREHPFFHVIRGLFFRGLFFCAFIDLETHQRDNAFLFPRIL